MSADTEQAESPLRIAVAGVLAGRARFHESLLFHNKVTVAAILDADSRTARIWSREFRTRPAVFTDLDQLFASDAGIEAILVASPVSERAAILQSCALAGISTLVDFPFAESLTDIDDQIALSAENHTIVWPCGDHLFQPAVTTMLRALERGDIGMPGRLKAEISFPLTAQCAMEYGADPIGLDWYELLQAVACRSAELAIGCLGTPVSVNADIDLPRHAAIPGRVPSDPVANLILTHEQGASTHLLKLSRSVLHSERYLIAGDGGTLELTLRHGERAPTVDTGPIVRLHRIGARPETLYISTDESGDRIAAMEALIGAFAEAVRSGRNGQNITAARTAMEAVHGAFLSASEGIRIPLPMQKLPDIEAMLEAGSRV